MNRREILLAAGALAACQSQAQAPLRPNYLASRSVNLGNALEAPGEGDWGYRIEPSHIHAIAAAGFDGVRLPVRWDAHTTSSAPYEIAAPFLERVEEVVLLALTAGLKVQLDLHHYEALIANPQTEQPRFLAIWRQIAERLAAAPVDDLAFEPLNEPFGVAWNGQLLTDLQTQVISVIRAVSPNRTIILGGGNWQSIDGLNQWTPPQAERLVISAHYYEPYAFTHHRAAWLGAEAPIYNRQWGKSEDVARVREHIAAAARWSRAHGLPLQIGEFGVNIAVPLPQRALWTRTVREACEHEGAAWAVWDFAGAFPIYDRDGQRFVPQMLGALGLGR